MRIKAFFTFLPLLCVLAVNLSCIARAKDLKLCSCERQSQEALNLFEHKSLPALQTEGNRIIDDNGEQVWLQGVNVPSLEWNPDGEHVISSILVAVNDWNANLIRLPVLDKFWFGHGEGWREQDDGGVAYRKLIDECIKTANAIGAYVILDLHRYMAPDKDALKFWESASESYKNQTGVLFGLFNEPHDVDWQVWKQGGEVEAEWEMKNIVGHQCLVNTVRQSGAENIIIAGGLDWAYDLSGVLSGYALQDKNWANGIVYDAHVYNWKRDWEDNFLAVSEKYPVIIGEWGAQPEGSEFDFVPAEQQIAPDIWVPDFIELLNKRQLHHAAWSFHPEAEPCLIQNFNYDPTPYFGVYVKEFLRSCRMNHY